MVNNSIQIRELGSEHIPAAMDLVLSEGWNQTIKDWQLLINNPQNVCLAAEVDGKLVGTVTTINYNDEVAWIGMVLVNKEYRGQGISKTLLSAILKQLTSCKSIKLDATPAGQPVYKKIGFEDEYIISRMINPDFHQSLGIIGETVPQQIQKKDIPEIIKFDKQAFGADRSRLISALIHDFPKKCLVLKHGNEISGFALGRRGNKHHQIGPVMTKSYNDAKVLISYALKDLQEQSIVIDILEDKTQLAGWLCNIGFEKQRNFTRMFLGNNTSPGIISQQYFISGPEFG